ncbi:hypothetical protein BS50DRAFT_576747 [Corynespora cassiicola Philippines]|uniref:Uncharacterized protein n=1 Tax=Corynespora cassiicola Philippines TaxID=1448308 RepID=A0A2T2NGK2_CORCC|nr:hypothetical protein BS50DRAFT_576747 [Corynespora cassiicola Philippines]
MEHTRTVAILGTCDTKLDELLYLRHEMGRVPGTETILIDVGRSETKHSAISITSGQLLQKYGNGQKVADLSRNEVIKAMSSCATKAVKELFSNGKIHGIVAAGGSCGTSLGSAVMRDALPIGFPKLIVSTVASGDTGPIIEETDITLMYSVVDVAGLNQVLRNILSNAALAMAAMAGGYASRVASPETTSQPEKPRVGITMFGVTTPAVDTIRKRLETKYGCEAYIFHATGHGGKAMERLVNEGQLDAVLDLTTTEICDHLTGGVMSAGPSRLEAAVKAGIPTLVSVGATDMTNFGPVGTVPDKYKQRKLFEHNPVVTLMRTNVEEARKVGGFISTKLKAARDASLVQVWLPMGGISMIAVPGGPFEDKEADEAMFAAIKEGLQGSNVKIVEDQRAINDESFANDVADALARMVPGIGS